MFSATLYSVEVVRVVARSVIASTTDVGEQSRALAVLLALVMLLPIFDQSALALVARLHA
jgi:hypothetical protein